MVCEELLCKKLNLYFIGIGGISMSGLAKYFFSLGYGVRGCDITVSSETLELERLGIKVFYKHQASNIEGAEIIIYNSAIGENNKEIKAAKKEGKFLMPRSALLGYVARQFKKSIAVCGSHGKTTATAMISHVLMQSDKGITCHIGGKDLTLDNMYTGGDDIFITEACEYKKNFLNMTADLTVLLNIDNDHLECFDGENDLVESFAKFCNLSKLTFVNADDIHSGIAKNSVSFGIDGGDYRAVRIKKCGEKYSFTVIEYGKRLGRFGLNVYGRHNIYNALAAITVGRYFGMGVKSIKEGLKAFKGIKRRFEKIGEVKGAEIICDYAHHPKEIAASLSVGNKICKKELYVIFQPHTYSRTKNLFDDFVGVFKNTAKLCIYKTYPAREKFDVSGSGETLSKAIDNSVYFSEAAELSKYLLENLKKGDTALFLGAGDIYGIAGNFTATYV